jgi:hypothetical protein
VTNPHQLERSASEVRAACYVKIVEQFPMTVGGDVQKFKLRGTAVAGLGLESAAGVQTV